MHLLRSLTAAALVFGFATPAFAATDPADAGAAARIEADVRFLADDLLEGREAGTRGYEIAARYVSNRFRALGLAGGGDAGDYLQQVSMLKAERRSEGARFVLHQAGGDRAFVFEEEFVSGINFTAGSAEVRAPLVFVGYGVHAPDLGYDSLAGVDLKGRIVVTVGGAPSTLAGDPRAHHADSTTKYHEFERRGAVGVISIQNPVLAARYPWASNAESWRRPAMTLLDAEGRAVEDFPGLRARVGCSLVAAEALFSGARMTLAEAVSALKKGERPAFELPGSATLATAATVTPVSSPNVVARLPGTDPARSAQHIVFTAHLDHIGIGVPKNGDAIYNGAMDNALGVAVLLEAARALATQPLERSVVFVATTAEEKGLLGAQHFAAQPLPDNGSMVAIVNMDMPLALGDLTDVTPIGIEHSSLQAVAERAATEAGFALSPDPFPEEFVFVRSDQYPFIQQGVPAIYLDAGYKTSNGVDGKARHEQFLKERYHLPGDDLSQPIDWLYSARLANVNANIARAIAADPRPPRWNKGDFFGERFGK